MMSKTLARRLERLAAQEMHSPRVLKILVTRIGEPAYTIELVLDQPCHRLRGFWQGNPESDT
jgi:hypothetical protein